jgi:hypothetical protein
VIAAALRALADPVSGIRPSRRRPAVLVRDSRNLQSDESRCAPRCPAALFCVHQIQRSACLPFKNGNYILKSLLAALVINLILLQPSYGGVSAGCINGRGPITILKTPSGSDLSVLPLWRSLYASPSAFTRLRNGSFTSFGLKSRFASTVLPQGHAYTVSGSGSCALGDSGGGSLSATGPDAGSTPQFSDFNSRQSSAASGYASIEPRSYSISTVAVGFPAKPVDSLLKSGNRGDPAFFANSRNEIISFCCRTLMPSSTTNRHMVQTDSIATPAITSHVATRWTAAEYFGRSSSMPAPTAIPANTLNDNKTAWGQKASAEPASRLFMYLGITAIFVWAVVVLMALGRLFHALLAIWKR